MKIYKYILIAAMVSSFSACSEDVMDKINKDESNPPVDAVPAKFQITDAIMSTAFATVSGDYSFYVASLTEQELGTGNNQLMKAELRNSSEWAASTTFNNVWNSTYGNLMNIKNIIDKIENEVPGNAGQYDLLGMAQVLKVINFGILTDMHGDIPYFDALKGQGDMQPKLDAQKDIYPDLIKTIDAAIANLEAGAGMKSAGAQDILFSNNTTKWLAAAYALKARYCLHQIAVNPAALALAEAAAEEAIALGFQGMPLTCFNGIDCDNPWSAYLWSRNFTATSATMGNLMDDDPRLDVYTYWKGQTYKPGDSQMAMLSPGETVYPAWLDLGAQPVNIVNSSEVYFILAECQLRSGKDATDAFTTAVANSLDEYNGLAAEFGGDFDPDDVLASLGTPDLKTLFEQKYISQAIDQQVEAYNDLRRLAAMGEEYVVLTNPNNTQSGVNRFPYCLPYGNSSVLSNPNVKEAYGDGYYIYSTKTWVNGGK